jgi:hypothetical protein
MTDVVQIQPLRDGADQQFITDPVGGMLLPVDLDLSVSVRGDMTLPKPAFVGVARIHKRPEASQQCSAR